MQTEGLTFPETVERLAQDAGLQLPARSPETERQEQRRAGLHEVLEWAAAFFEAELAGTRGGKARAYIDGRGIAAATRREFRLGYAPPERHALRDALAAKGASVETMCEAGLLIHGEDIPVAYDKFRDRVMFPIADRQGRVIAFGGRALEKDVQAKYMNSPETPVFHKGAGLYNHHRARKAAHAAGRVIAVEGYIDVIAMHAAGFPETVAALGTALTEEQAGLLWQMAPQPILCFDGDKAGRKAAWRTADMALPLIAAGRTFAFALLPEGQDPDELIRAAGAPAMRAALDAAQPLVDVIWGRETETRILTTPEQRAGLERDLGEIATTIRDEALRRHYRADFDARLKALFGPAAGYGGARPARPPFQRQGFGRQGGRGGFVPAERLGYLSAPILASSSLTQSAAFRVTAGATVPAREALIMVILLAHPGLVEELGEEIAGLDFAAPELAAFRDGLVDLAHDIAFGHGDVEASLALRDGLAAAGFEAVLAKLERSGASSAWYLKPEAAPQDAAEVLRQALTLHRKSRALHKELLSAEVALATDASDANMARMRDIQEQIGALTGMEAAIEGFGVRSGRSGPAL